QARASGDLRRSVAIQADLSLEKVRFEKIKIDSLKGTIRCSRIQPISFDEMHLTARNPVVSGFELGEVVQIDGRAGATSNLTVRVSRRGENLELVMRGEATPARVDVAIEKLALEGKQERLALTQPARLRWQRGKSLELGPAEISGEIAGVKIPN